MASHPCFIFFKIRINNIIYSLETMGANQQQLLQIKTAGETFLKEEQKLIKLTYRG